MLRILRAIAQEKDTASQIAKQIKLKLSSLPYYLQELERYDLIQKKDGGYKITDKVVRDYFAAAQV